MSKIQYTLPPPITVGSSQLSLEEIRLLTCYRSLPARDRYAMRCLVFVFEETNKLHVASHQGQFGGSAAPVT